MGEQQTVSLVRDGHAFVFRYFDTPVGRFRLYCSLQMRLLDSELFMPLDAGLLWTEAEARARGYAMERAEA